MPTNDLAEQQAFLNDLDARLWNAADKLRQQLDAANYKHIVLGFIFLKYVSDSFKEQREKLQAQFANPDSEDYLDPEFYDEDAVKAELEERDNYTKDNVFWLPEEARWENIRSVAKFHIGESLPWATNGEKFKGIANLIDDAFAAIERDNPKTFKTRIQRISQFNVEPKTLIDLVDLFSQTDFSRPMYNGKPIHLAAKDILGHVYEYFLGEFAIAEGKKGGQFFTPKSIVTLIVEMLEPYKGRVYDPAMGTGGFFVQTDRFIQAHQGNRNAISVYGQEFNPTTWQLAVMNMAIRGISFDFGEKYADTFANPQHLDVKMDFIMANPPFNMDEWWNESLAQDPRWKFGTPPKGNANFAWIQHMIHQLSPKGKIGLVLANGSMSSQQSGEGDIRKNIIQADLVEAMIALPGQLFTNVPVPACIWVINKAKPTHCQGKVLFIDARQLGFMKTRKQRDFTAEDIAQVADCYHQWQKGEDYQDRPAFCYAATLDEIEKNDFVLTPGRYVGTPEQEDDGEPFAEKMQKLTALLNEQFEKSAELEGKIRANLSNLGF